MQVGRVVLVALAGAPALAIDVEVVLVAVVLGVFVLAIWSSCCVSSCSCSCCSSCLFIATPAKRQLKISSLQLLSLF